eukprot:TRINITY_DN3324_c0_g2_i3.p1 TRINITY_DN3324_c0_g2~~TRINITY_DN3324_c0_g2_i3.p1  ORF type:complete len:639 (+),score=210.27 TRINITY_DN3324_c0_g2_i3:586-2502(+)
MTRSPGGWWSLLARGGSSRAPKPRWRLGGPLRPCCATTAFTPRPPPCGPPTTFDAPSTSTLPGSSRPLCRPWRLRLPVATAPVAPMAAAAPAASAYCPWQHRGSAAPPLAASPPLRRATRPCTTWTAPPPPPTPTGDTDASVKSSRRPGEDESLDESEVDYFKRSGRLGGGLLADIRRRYKPSVYLSDWTDGVRDSASLLKYLSTIVWLYFAILMPTIAFGSLNNENTAVGGSPKGQIGVIETLISQAVCGFLFAALAGQPLVIIMTTGPLTVFINVLATWTRALDIPFLPFLRLGRGSFTAAILAVLVVTDAFSLMRFCGYFTEEIFAALIAAIFIGEFLKPLIKLADKGPTDVFLLSFVLASCTYLIASTLLSFKRSYLLKPFIRMLLSEFGVPIAIVTMSAINVAFRPSVEVELLEVPDEIGIVTSTGRPWVVPLFDLPAQFIALAGVAAALLAALFFLDQNISALLVNRPENRLLKGPGYHLDLLIVAALVAGTSIFGLTWTHAALPHSPLHARALADTEEYEAHGRRHERVVRARETRLTGLLTHVLIGLSILFKDAIGQIPVSVLYGFFLYIGIATLEGNGLWDRVLLWFTQAEKYPPTTWSAGCRCARSTCTRPSRCCCWWCSGSSRPTFT